MAHGTQGTCHTLHKHITRAAHTTCTGSATVGGSSMSQERKGGREGAENNDRHTSVGTHGSTDWAPGHSPTRGLHMNV